MECNILSWYERSRIEEIIENKLTKYGLNLPLPQIVYKIDKVLIDREIDIPVGKSRKSITISREFHQNHLPIEDIVFDLEKNTYAVIADRGDNEGYTAFCFIYHKNKKILSLLKNVKELKLFVGEERNQMNRYDFKGNIEKLTEILTEYWITKFYKRRKSI